MSKQLKTACVITCTAEDVQVIYEKYFPNCKPLTPEEISWVLQTVETTYDVSDNIKLCVEDLAQQSLVTDLERVFDVVYGKFDTHEVPYRWKKVIKAVQVLICVVRTPRKNTTLPSWGNYHTASQFIWEAIVEHQDALVDDDDDQLTEEKLDEIRRVMGLVADELGIHMAYRRY